MNIEFRQPDVRRNTGAVLRTPRGLCVLLALLWLSGCGSTPEQAEEKWSPEKLYAEAKEEAAAGSYERAGKLYERLEGRASGTALAQQAQLERAYMHYKNGDKAQALSVLERFVKVHPSSPGLDYALYLQGLVHFIDNLGLLGSLGRQDLTERDQQASRDSFQSFKQLVEQFPQSIYADDARTRMNYILNTLAAYEVHVARYYYRRQAYLAAVNRAQQVVTEFQESPSTQEALLIMAQSYDRLGLNDLRDDARRVLNKNFSNPDPTTSTSTTQPQRAWWQLW